MSETVKFRTFCTQPLNGRPVADVPGVGPIAARKLKSLNYTKAEDLYNRLKKLNFDEKKFRVWIKLNCRGARVSTIYKALMGWNSQFEHKNGDNDSENARAVTPVARPEERGGAGGSRPSIIKARKPRNSVQFNLPESTHQTTSINNTPKTNDSNIAMALFFESFAGSCKYISPEFYTDLKMDILKTVRKYEIKTKEMLNGHTLSTSTANGV